MQLLTADQSYQVTEASLFAFALDPKHPLNVGESVFQSGFFWHLEVNTTEGLSFWHEDIRVPHLARWEDLVGQELSWEVPADRDAGEWYGAGLIAGNSIILQSRLGFVERAQCDLRIQWKGTATTSPPGAKLDPERDLPFELNCWCTFVGVGVLNHSGITDSAKRELIAQFVDVSGFSESFVDAPDYIPGTLPMLKPRC